MSTSYSRNETNKSKYDYYTLHIYICIFRQFKCFSKFHIEGDSFRLGVRQCNCPPVDNSIVSCLTENCAGIDPDITNQKLICRLLAWWKQFVNVTDFDNLMQEEGTNLPLIELQDQNLNPTVVELTVTGYSDKKLNTNPLKNIRGSFTPYITNSVVNFTIHMSN
jgi:hypothetical protein